MSAVAAAVAVAIAAAVAAAATAAAAATELLGGGCWSCGERERGGEAMREERAEVEAVVAVAEEDIMGANNGCTETGGGERVRAGAPLSAIVGEASRGGVAGSGVAGGTVGGGQSSLTALRMWPTAS